MSDLEPAILASLRSSPASGGKLIERLQAEGSASVREDAVRVYGALANLRARGEAHIVATGPGEVVWGLLPDATAEAAQPGFAPSFSLSAADLAQLEREVWRMTDGLPRHYFEELRRAAVADADRRVFHGQKLPRAVASALDQLGPSAGAVRRFLKRVERGGPVGLRLAEGRLRRWLMVPLVLVAVFALARLFVFGVYTIPLGSTSMAPTLLPANEEGGDRWVIVALYAYWFDAPARGDVVAFEVRGRDDPLVKRVMGLPGETIGLKKGDVYVGGKRLVKERPLLDRVKVRLFSLDDLAPTRDPAGWEQREPAHDGYRLPDGRTNPGLGARCRDVVVTSRFRFGGEGSVTFLLEDGNRTAYLVAVTHQDYDVAMGKIGVAHGRFARRDEHEVWFTNADGLFRVEIDGRQVAREPLRRAAGRLKLRIVTEGAVDIEDADVSRDLIHERAAHAKVSVWKLGDDEYFLLGDNSARSRDSRHFGPVPAEQILGRVLRVAWPPSRARAVD